MNEELSLRLQAYADGELSEREAREVESALAHDAEGRALLLEIKNTRSALAGYEAEIKLPESREFYWSKIERQIQGLEKAEPARPEISPFAALRRFFVPAGALAVVLLIGLLFFPTASSSLTAQSEFAFADADGFTYHDYANGTTLVWLSYPAENEFASGDSADTLD